MTLYISEILKKIAKAKTRKEKKAFLEEHKTNNVFRFVLQGVFDPNIKWNTPTKMPKYEPDVAPIGLNETSLFTVMPKCSIFVEGRYAGIYPLGANHFSNFCEGRYLLATLRGYTFHVFLFQYREIANILYLRKLDFYKQ